MFTHLISDSTKPERINTFLMNDLEGVKSFFKIKEKQ